jgi:hypothetical protein
MMRGSSNRSRSDNLDVGGRIEILLIPDKLGRPNRLDKGRISKLDNGKKTLHEGMPGRLFNSVLVQEEGHIGGGNGNGCEETKTIVVFTVNTVKSWIKCIFIRRFSIQRAIRPK